MKLASFLAQQTSLGDQFINTSYLWGLLHGGGGGRQGHLSEWALSRRKLPHPLKLMHRYKGQAEWWGALPAGREEELWQAKSVLSYAWEELQSLQSQPWVPIAVSPPLGAIHLRKTSWEHFTWRRNPVMCQSVHILVFARGLHLTPPSLSPWAIKKSKSNRHSEN